MAAGALRRPASDRGSGRQSSVDSRIRRLRACTFSRISCSSPRVEEVAHADATAADLVFVRRPIPREVVPILRSPRLASDSRIELAVVQEESRVPAR